MILVATLLSLKCTRVSLLIIALMCAFVQPIARAHREVGAPNSEAANLQNQGGVPGLQVDKPIKRELAGGQSDAYQITLAEGQYCR